MAIEYEDIDLGQVSGNGASGGDSSSMIVFDTIQTSIYQHTITDPRLPSTLSELDGKPFMVRFNITSSPNFRYFQGLNVNGSGSRTGFIITTGNQANGGKNFIRLYPGAVAGDDSQNFLPQHNVPVMIMYSKACDGYIILNYPRLAEDGNSIKSIVYDFNGKLTLVQYLLDNPDSFDVDMASYRVSFGEFLSVQFFDMLRYDSEIEVGNHDYIIEAFHNSRIYSITWFDSSESYNLSNFSIHRDVDPHQNDIWRQSIGTAIFATPIENYPVRLSLKDPIYGGRPRLTAIRSDDNTRISAQNNDVFIYVDGGFMEIEVMSPDGQNQHIELRDIYDNTLFEYNGVNYSRIYIDRALDQVIATYYIDRYLSGYGAWIKDIRTEYIPIGYGIGYATNTIFISSVDGVVIVRK